MSHVSLNCRYRYPDGFAVDAQLAARQRVTALVGPSGSGKTTLLMLIAGLLRPSDGRITLGDRVLVDTETDVWVPPHRRGIGLVFQDSLLFPHRTVKANLMFGRRRRKYPSIQPDDVIETLELSELLHRRPSTLSGGQSRRVAIGRALLRGPELLLLDEPWVGLDPPLQDTVIQWVQRCIEHWQIPTMLVSHDHAMVASMTEERWVVESGRVLE